MDPLPASTNDRPKSTSILADYAFDRAPTTPTDFFWKEFCAYYVELVKPILFGKTGTPEQRANKQRILLHRPLQSDPPLASNGPIHHRRALPTCSRKKSPQAAAMSPICTRNSPSSRRPACIVSPYPTVISEADIDPEIEATFALMDRVVHAVRNIRAEMQLAPNITTDLLLKAPKADPTLALVQQNAGMLKALVRIGEIEMGEPSGFSATSVIEGLTLIIPLPEEMKEKSVFALSNSKKS